MGNEETTEPSSSTVSEEKKKRARSRGHVTIFGTWCKGCGICIAFCPQGVFEANGQVSEAIGNYVQAVELEPDGPGGLLARRALERMGVEIP